MIKRQYFKTGVTAALMMAAAMVVLSGCGSSQTAATAPAATEAAAEYAAGGEGSGRDLGAPEEETEVAVDPEAEESTDEAETADTDAGDVDADADAEGKDAEGKSQDAANIKKGRIAQGDTKKTSDGDAIPELLAFTRYYSEYGEYDGEFTQLVQMEKDSVFLSDDSAKRYPALAKTLKEIDRSNIENDQETLAYLKSDAEDLLGDRGVDYFGGLSDNERMLLRRADSGIVSLLGDYSAYGGGAHGYFGYYGHNYNTKTGKELKLSDVVTDLDRTKEKVLEALLSSYQKEIFFDTMEETLDTAFSEDADLEPSFSIEPDGLTFWFNPYEIAPYVAGVQRVRLLFAEEPDLFRPICTETALENYAIELPGYVTSLMDLGSDGELDELEVYAVPGDDENYYSHSGVQITINGNEQTFETYDFYESYAMVVHAYEHDILLVHVVTDNDYRNMYIYDLTPEGATALGDEDSYFTLHIPEKYEEDYNGSWRAMLTNTDHFEMTSFYDILSTLGATRWYSIGAQDVFIPETAEFDIENDYVTLTTNADFEFPTVDEKTGRETGKTVEVPAGTELSFYRTDNVTYTDMKDKDGTIYRITLDKEGDAWGGRIQGIYVMDAFEGMLFAG